MVWGHPRMSSEAGGRTQLFHWLGTNQEVGDTGPGTGALGEKQVREG